MLFGLATSALALVLVGGPLGNILQPFSRLAPALGLMVWGFAVWSERREMDRQAAVA